MSLVLLCNDIVQQNIKSYMLSWEVQWVYMQPVALDVQYSETGGMEHLCNWNAFPNGTAFEAP
jgi:hypothetical protein